MVIYGTIEIDGRTMARAKSDRGKYIVDGEGRYYADAVCPAGDARAFTESEIDVDDEVPRARVFSKLKVVVALTKAGVWPQVKAWIESVPGAYDLYLAAEDISEDEPLLKDGISEMKKLLRWTDEQVEAVLAASAI